MDEPHCAAGLRYKLKSRFPPRRVLRPLVVEPPFLQDAGLNRHLSEIVPLLLYFNGSDLFLRSLLGVTISLKCSGPCSKKLLDMPLTIRSLSGKFRTSFL